MPRRKLSGPRSRYRRKVRLPVSILLTPDGHALLAQQLAVTRLSRSDWVETLIRWADEHPLPDQSPQS